MRAMFPPVKRSSDHRRTGGPPAYASGAHPLPAPPRGPRAHSGILTHTNTTGHIMIARTLVHSGRRNASAAVGLGLGLGLATSLSAQRQEQPTTPAHADSIAASTPPSSTRYEPPLPPTKARSIEEPTLREDVSLSYNNWHSR